ncbi:ROK family transcriptional regulator [Actinomadura sp. 6K520]|uniref:ROK family transcriptional regulator n=1 Tax=Actinomadura sp. 6K520 TaxID=2530364 RepID=UPI001045BDF1|nr:ROK family transcriptional regulator [Actinomadura sp. 6K520]TDE21435.1 ROK family transcriptional regulator [Actinomadura sp. 6K520]
MTKSANAPVRHATMRERNLAVVLEHIARHQPVTRARLAELTGFTKTTVSNLVALLEGAGLVRGGAPVHEGERGRPGVGVSVRGDGAAGLGLEVNVDYLAACVLDLGKRVRYRHVISSDHRGRAPGAVLAALSALAAEAVAAVAAQGLSVAGAAVALPGLLDREDGVVRHAPNLGWTDVPVTGAPGLDLALPTEYDNEANLAALGELWFGGGAGLGDFVHVSGEIGIGAGIVVDGRVFRGAHGFAGELGHLVAEPSGPPCSCGGRGCLEQIAGQEAILRAAGLPVTGPDTAPDDPVRALVGRLDAGDPAARDAVDRAGRALGGALASVVNLIDPDTVVLGGVFSPLAGWIRPPIEAVLAGGSGSLRRGAPPVEVSGLAEGAAVLGAAGLVIERVIAGPALLLQREPPAGAR